MGSETREQADAQDSGVVKSVGRVFEVLEAFHLVRQPMAAMQMANRLSYPPSSTVALLKSMTKLGYLSFNRRNKTYFPTVRIVVITEYLRGALFGEGRLMGLLGDLHTLSGETVVLAIQNDLDVQYLHVILGTYPIMLNVPPGTIRPLCRSGTGWALLAGYSNDEIEKLVKRVNARGSDPEVNADELIAIIEEVRALGYARSYSTYVQGSGAIAMPLPCLIAEHRVVIGVGGPVDRLRTRERELLRIMRKAISVHFPAQA